VIKHIAATAAFATIALGALSAPAQAADGVFPPGSAIIDNVTVIVVPILTTIVQPVGQVLPSTTLPL
jgi:hypothetical protein